MSGRDLNAWWMPFTANAAFKRAPKLLSSAQGIYYQTSDGRQLIDGICGLWCVNAGHGRPEIVEAIARQAAELDYAPPFQMGHPLAFELAERLTAFAPRELGHAFFVNSGSEAVDTALKIARAVHRARGEPERVLLIGRERGYHGVGFGGVSVGGMAPNRAQFGPLLPAVDHLPWPRLDERERFVRGQAEGGDALADQLLHRIDLHGAHTIAAVIVEPVAGSAGVLVPPKGYLERLAEICRSHGILLIFDEVITGFGRLGARFAAERFGVVPDLMSVAKGLTNGAVPMGAVLAKPEVYDALVGEADRGIELFHGYTYSAHPLACAAGLATLEIHERERLWERAAALSAPFEDSLHALVSAPDVVDVRNLGLMGAVELEPDPEQPGARARAVFERCYERGALIRYTGDTLAFCPPLVIEESELAQLFEIVREALESRS